MGRRRFYAQAAVSGAWLDLDLQLRVEAGPRHELSGGGSMSGFLSAGDPLVKWVSGRPQIDPWSVYLYEERDGILRWGGVVRRTRPAGSELFVEASGFSSYPNGMPYTGSLYSSTSVNPMTVVGVIWSHLQAQPDGNLGMLLVNQGTCPVRLGSKEQPYQLAWWEAPDLGSELSQIATQTPLDMVERHSWTGPTTVKHELIVSYPRAGRRRSDLVFTPDNSRAAVELERDGDTFANNALVVGKGEGAKSIIGRSGIRDGRLRRVAVYVDKLTSTKARADALALRERNVRQLSSVVSSITVQDHPNAPLGSWALGDDIYVETEMPHVGEYRGWHRVVGWEMLPGSDSAASLSLQPAESFHYGGLAQ